MKQNLKITYRKDLKTRQEILERKRALENQLNDSMETQNNFKTKDDRALSSYQSNLRARIQELSWMLNDTQLYPLPNNLNTEE